MRWDGRNRGAERAALIQAGTNTVNVNASVAGSASVTFDTPFPAGATVRVIPTVRGSSVWMAYLPSTPTNTGFTVGVRQVQGVSSTATVTVDWIAMVDNS